LRTCSALLRLCSRQIEPVRALAILEYMKARGLQPDADCYQAAMDACAQEGALLNSL
jgi:pentatricopeptide repeat protein